MNEPIEIGHLDESEKTRFGIYNDAK